MKDEGLDGANVVSDLSPAQVQQAKDFIWDKMEDAGRSLILKICPLSPIDRQEYYIKRILFRMEAKKNGSSFEEVFIISPEYSLVEFPLEKAHI